MSHRWIALSAALLLLGALGTWWSELARPRPVALIPTLSGQPEYCLTCHSDLREISPSHPIKVFGCVSCHGGERLALDAALAHSSMRGGANPSDLSVVQESCGGGECHSGSPNDQRDHIQRVSTSVQSTYAGAIASILYTFGAQTDLTARYGIKAVTDDKVTTTTGVNSLETFDAAHFDNPFVQKFSTNCTVCHLNASPGEDPQYNTFSGCAACHSPLTEEDKAGTTRDTHVLTTAIPYSTCNACHNRGNYDLRTMTFIPRSDHPSDRLHDYYQPIAQFTRCEYTLDCIDCHTRTEAMGDGDIHSNKKEIQYIQCKTCHGTLTELPRTVTLTDPTDIAFRQAQLNPVVSLPLGSVVLATDKGEPLWNTSILPDGTYELVGKASGERFKFRPVMGSGCTQNPDQQASQYCHECHSIQR